MACRGVLRLAALAVIVAWPPLAPSAPAGEDAGAIVLGGPEVEKVGWNTRALLVHDLNGDSRLDLGVLDNDRRRIELLFQLSTGASGRDERVSRFERRSLATGRRMFDLQAGDLDGDGRSDLAFTAQPGGLVVHYQDEDGAFERVRVFDQVDPNGWTESLRIDDLDGDGRNDLLVLAENKLHSFFQGAEGELSEGRTYAVGAQSAYGLRLVDIDGDGRRDVYYVAPNSTQAWRVRLQREERELGPEQLFPESSPRGLIVPVGRALSGPPAFAVVDSQTSLPTLLTLSAAEGGPHEELHVSPQVYATPSLENTATSYALGDVDGDGLEDLLVADRRGAQVWLLRQRPDGTFLEGKGYPSLSDLRGIALGDENGDGLAEVFVFSRREAVVGRSEMTPEGRLSYPEPLAVEGDPIALSAGDLDGDGRDELVLLLRRDKERLLTVLGADAEGRWAERQTRAVAELRADPHALVLTDADGDARLDALILARKGPLLVVHQHEQGGRFVETGATRVGGPSPVQDVKPVELGSGDVDGDGDDELLVAATGFARAFGPLDDALLVREQYNARSSGDVLAAALPVDLDGDGTGEMLLLERDAATLQVLRRDEEGVFRYDDSLGASPLDVVDARVVDLGRDGEPDLLALGAEGFWTLPVRGSGWTLEREVIYEPEIEEIAYSMVAAADLDGDGDDELLLLDANSTHILEIVRRRADRWESALHFRVFDTDPHYQNPRGTDFEPRELEVSDLDGDGRPDLLLLVHDRILIYGAR